MFRGLYPSSVWWNCYAQAEHLPRIQTFQPCLLSLPRNSVQTWSEKYMSIWPGFVDVQQSRRSDISSQKMRQDQQNPDTWQLYLFQHRWTGCILPWKTLSSLYLGSKNFYYKLEPFVSIYPCFSKFQLSLASRLPFVSPDSQPRKLICVAWLQGLKNQKKPQKLSSSSHANVMPKKRVRDVSVERELKTNLKSIADDDSKMKEQEHRSSRWGFLKRSLEQQTTLRNPSTANEALSCSLTKLSWKWLVHLQQKRCFLGACSYHYSIRQAVIMRRQQPLSPHTPNNSSKKKK